MDDRDKSGEPGSNPGQMITGFDIDGSFVWPWRIASGLLVFCLGGMWLMLLFTETAFGLLFTPIAAPLIWIFYCRGHFTGKTDLQLYRDYIRYKGFLLWHKYRYDELAGFAVQYRHIANKSKGDVLFLKTVSGRVKTMFVLHTFEKPSKIVPALDTFTGLSVDRLKDFDLTAFKEWKTSGTSGQSF